MCKIRKWQACILFSKYGLCLWFIKNILQKNAIFVLSKKYTYEYFV